MSDLLRLNNKETNIQAKRMGGGIIVMPPGQKFFENTPFLEKYSLIEIKLIKFSLN